MVSYEGWAALALRLRQQGDSPSRQTRLAETCGKGCRHLWNPTLSQEARDKGGAAQFVLYSYLNASMGSRFAARIAGSIPLINPTTSKIPVETARFTGEMISRMSPASACEARAL